MLLRHLFEGKWWDESPTITLYHGTSSVLLPAIREHGLLPPPSDVSDYVRQVLLDLLPEDQWPWGFHAEMVKKVSRHRDLTERSLYFFPADREDSPSARRYARSYAQFGGEIANDCWSWLNAYRTDAGLPKLPPRWPHGEPVLLTVEVPKTWCIWAVDLDQMREKLRKHWDAKNPHFIMDDEGEPYATFEELLDDVVEDREVRVARPVPPEMIKDVRAL